MCTKDPGNVSLINISLNLSYAHKLLYNKRKNQFFKNLHRGLFRSTFFYLGRATFVQILYLFRNNQKYMSLENIILIIFVYLVLNSICLIS